MQFRVHRDRIPRPVYAHHQGEQSGDLPENTEGPAAAVHLGDKDPVGRYGEGVRRTVNLYRGNGVKNIEVIFYKDARHEVLNELDRLETFGDISVGWRHTLPQGLQGRLSSRSRKRQRNKNKTSLKRLRGFLCFLGGKPPCYAVCP